MEDDKLITQKRKGRTKKDGIPLLFFVSLGSIVFLLTPLFVEQSRTVSVHFPFVSQTPNCLNQASPLLFKLPDVGGAKILTIDS